MSSSNQRPANRGFRSVLRCAISHYRQSSCLSAPEPPGTDGAYSAQWITRYCALANVCRRAALNLCGIQVIPCVEKHDDKASFGMIHATTLID